jgi:hypothetical protein
MILKGAQNLYIICTHSSEKLVPIYQTLRRHIRKDCSLNGHHVTTSNVVGATIVTVTRSALFCIREVLFNDDVHCSGYSADYSAGYSAGYSTGYSARQ